MGDRQASRWRAGRRAQPDPHPFLTAVYIVTAPPESGFVRIPEKPLRAIVKPFERMLDHLPKVYIKDSAVDAVCHGADVAVPGINRIEGKFGKGQIIAVMTQKGEGIAIGEAKMPSSKILETKKGSAINLQRVFMAPGTYPKLWKRGTK